jgi:hypothetical protein
MIGQERGNEKLTTKKKKLESEAPDTYIYERFEVLSF